MTTPDRLSEIRQRRAAVEWSDALAAIPDWQTLEFRSVHDKKFIAHAPEDMDWLLREVERLRALIPSERQHATCRICGEPITYQVGQWWHDETSRDHDATL